MPRDVRSDVNGNWVAWLEATTNLVEGGEMRRFGPVACGSVGIPIPLFNQVFVFEPPQPENLEAAVAWIAARGVPFWMTVPDHLLDLVRQSTEAAGLVPGEGAMPGMVLASLEELGSGDSFAQIVPVSDPAQLEHVALVTGEAFGAPLGQARALVPASVLEEDDMRWFVGYVDGEPAACGQLLRTGDVAGVYAIGVRAAFRRHGIGEAVTRRVLLAGAEAGCRLGVLQATPMGRSVYRRMGFNETVDYHRFVPSV